MASLAVLPSEPAAAEDAGSGDALGSGSALQALLHGGDLVVDALGLVHAGAEAHVGRDPHDAHPVMQHLVRVLDGAHDVVPVAGDVRAIAVEPAGDLALASLARSSRSTSVTSLRTDTPWPMGTMQTSAMTWPSQLLFAACAMRRAASRNIRRAHYSSSK
eukprot:CAMPEP_0204572676 /NCGR_PEP_ID=MMETSP0661-20131031/39596_1 /ASSEMBLY_ACC=CAM_ASM_000606 /TAXON_ID=109239 /ORGANISM="Alexandrium margalefi, Strain AMGDE01CS-322" /LENGTH=159 /DNA_ID=CAMNT_0051581041 /DNA_START=33 /DNA_END=511 /DNA_ORIENTATION=-